MISQTRSGATIWFHNIHNGPTNVSHLTNSSGAVVQKYGFDAFGNLTSSSGTTTNNYQFQTKELHPKSNLVYFGARWYNPAIGRWLTPDPLGIIDGPNLYIYLNNNPLNDIDPWGLCAGVKGFWEKVWSAYLNNNLSKNGYVDIGINLGWGEFGFTLGVKIAPNGVYGYYGVGSGFGLGAAITYNVGGIPSVGTSFTGTASGGTGLFGGRYQVKFSPGGQSTSVGVGVGFGYGGTVTFTNTRKIF